MNRTSYLRFTSYRLMFVFSLPLTLALAALCIGCAATSPESQQAQVVSATGVFMPPGSPSGHAQVVYTIVLTSKKNVQVIAVWRESTRLKLDSPKEGAVLQTGPNTLRVFEASPHSVYELEADRSLPSLSVAGALEVELAQGSKGWRLRAPVVSAPATGPRPQ